MRDLILILFTLGGLLATLRAPYVGLLLWVLYSIMNPHQETYSIARRIPWDLIIAIVTTGAWLMSSERKIPPRSATTWLVLALIAWSTFNTFLAFDPSFSWIYWNRAWKVVVMCILAGTMTTSMVRYQALMWTVVLSLAYYGVKGGLFTILTGGHSHVFGPEHTMIFDNNTLADALVMILPIMNYLRMQSESRALRTGIAVAMMLVLASILGSYSREGYIALIVVGISFWLRTRNKFTYPAIAVIVILILLNFMPETFFERFASIQHYQTDTSFQARLDSWYVAYRYAMDHIPFGAGFYGLNLQGVWDLYIPGEMHAAHSIYFQVLGEQGVIGLFFYLLIIAASFINLSGVKRDTRDNAEFAWARDLAIMMQLSLLAFCVGGAAAPIDFFDLFFLWAMLSAALRELTRKQKVPFAAQAGLMRDVQGPLPARLPPA